MREWLSGGAPPCQGGGRGFDPRLALEKRTIPNRYRSFFSSPGRARKFDVYAPVRAVRGPPDLVRRLALVQALISVFMVHKIIYCSILSAYLMR